MKEIWKNIDGYKNYKVSNLGRVKNIKKNIILAPILKSTGYIQFGISENGKAKCALAHRLVAEAFIPNPDNKPQVNHIDGIKNNNIVTNLEWNTPSENSLHTHNTLGYKVWHKGNTGKNTPTAKKVIQKTLDGKLVKVWDCASDAVREFGFDSGCITHTCKGSYKSHKGYKWEYAK